MFAVEVQNLRKEFFRRDAARTGLRRRRRRVAALEGVTFTMERGECVAILGQNGSGKSTLVRLLSTLLLPDGGTATIFGHDVVSEQRAVQRHKVDATPLVFDRDAIRPWKQVEPTLGFRLKRRQRFRDRARVDAVWLRLA